MMRRIKVIIIDPDKKQIRKIKIAYKKGKLLKGLYRVMDCHLVDIGLRIDRRNDLVVDDMGSFYESNAFEFGGQIFFGKAIICGVYKGNWVSTNFFSLDRIRKNVVFVDKSVADSFRDRLENISFTILE